MEELGELCHSVLKMRQNIRSDQNLVEAEKDALGDMLIYMIDYCNKRKFFLDEILQETWRQVKERDWITYPNNGRTH